MLIINALRNCQAITNAIEKNLILKNKVSDIALSLQRPISKVECR
jgi:hypothetical protein